MSPSRPPQPPIAPLAPREDIRSGTLPASAKVKKASTACLACKQRKSKCNEASPCEACQLRQTPCVYDRNADQRRRASIQRNMQQLNRQRTLLGGVLAIIRVGQPEQIEYLLDLIRHNVSLPDLAAHIESAINADPVVLDLSHQIMRSAEEHSHPSPESSRSNEDRIRPQSLILPPIIVPAQPWTALASDEAVSHLVSLYFTWEQPCLQFIDKTAFLVDMKAANASRLDGFCSPLLVSALLAQGCLISQRAECKGLRGRFLAEAKLRLELERGRASLTTLQALVLLFLHEGVCGRDRIGRIYHLQAIDMWGRLGLDRERSRPYDCEESEYARQSWRATTVAVWGIFCTQNFMSFLTGFEPSLSAPLMEKYFEFHSADERTDLDSRDGDWSPYPMQRPEQPALLAKTLSAMCSLCQMYQEISKWNRRRPEDHNASLGSQQDIKFRVEMLQKLTSWKAQLPGGLIPDDRSMAHTYHLSVFHLATLISLFLPLQDFEEVQFDDTTASPRELCFKYASESMEIVWTYRRAFSLRHSSCIGLLGPYMVVLTLSSQLRDGPHKSAPFVRACQALVEQGENFPVAPFILAMLQALDVEHQFGLPAEVLLILQALHFEPEDLADVPMEMQIPIPPRPSRAQQAALQSPGVVASAAVGELLAHWAGLSSDGHQ